jgi:hypothetical protein
MAADDATTATPRRAASAERPPARAIPELAPADTPEWLYAALGFKRSADGSQVVPTYPTGLPLLVLAAAQVVGWTQAGNVVLWLHGIAGVLQEGWPGWTFLARCAAIFVVFTCLSALTAFNYNCQVLDRVHLLCRASGERGPITPDQDLVHELARIRPLVLGSVQESG